MPLGSYVTALEDRMERLEGFIKQVCWRLPRSDLSPAPLFFTYLSHRCNDSTDFTFLSFLHTWIFLKNWVLLLYAVLGRTQESMVSIKLQMHLPLNIRSTLR